MFTTDEWCSQKLSKIFKMFCEELKRHLEMNDDVPVSFFGEKPIFTFLFNEITAFCCVNVFSKVKLHKKLNTGTIATLGS